MSLLEGQTLGRYHILEQLGEGGMATVYKAFDTRLERQVAVKVIRRSAFSPELLDLVLKRFEREGKALARLSHPNIVNVYDYGEYDGAPYLVMELIPGGSLKNYIGRPMPWPQAVRLLLPLARALSYAHTQDIIHRDIKPANILITASGEPMLTDFGIAKILTTVEGTTLTGTGVGIGTPEYMAPEQGMGSKVVDVRTDVYALGVVFYELLTGRKPYRAETPMAVVLKHITEPLPRPQQFVPDLPETIEHILIKALAKKPENRYADMVAFANALEWLLSAERELNGEAPLTKTLLPGLEATPTEPSEIETGGIPDQYIEPPLLEREKGAEVAQVESRITRLEKVIAESLAVEDFDGAESLVAALEGMGPSGKQAAVYLRDEIARAQESTQKRAAEIERLKANINDEIAHENFDPAEGLLDGLMALGENGRAEASHLRIEIDLAREQVAQRAARLDKITKATQDPLAHEDWEQVEKSIAEMRTLGSQGESRADQVETRLNHAREAAESRNAQILLLQTEIKSALDEEYFEQADRLLAELSALGAKGQAEATRLKIQLDKTKQKIERREAELTRLVQEAETALEEEHWPKVTRLANQMRRLGGPGTQQASDMESRLHQAQEAARQREAEVSPVTAGITESLPAAQITTEEEAHTAPTRPSVKTTPQADDTGETVQKPWVTLPWTMPELKARFSSARSAVSGRLKRTPLRSKRWIYGISAAIVIIALSAIALTKPFDLSVFGFGIATDEPTATHTSTPTHAPTQALTQAPMKTTLPSQTPEPPTTTATITASPTPAPTHSPTPTWMPTETPAPMDTAIPTWVPPTQPPPPTETQRPPTLPPPTATESQPTIPPPATEASPTIPPP